MRVTFVLPVLEVSGGARIVAGHAQQLMANGHEVMVVAAPPRRIGLRERAKILLNRVPAPGPINRSLVALAGLPFRIARREDRVDASDVPDADVIIATWWETAEWISTMPASKGAKIHFIQGYDASPDLADRVDAVWRLPFSKIAVAQWLVDLGQERFGIEDIALVPNSVDHQLFKPSVRERRRPGTVGFLFHPADFKDMPTTVAVIERLDKGIPGTRFIAFGGTKPIRGLLPKNVEFHLLPQQSKIAEIYRRCDAWISTSRQEGFNLPPLEAMASGCPAICAKTGRPLEIIKDGVNGYLVDQGDVDGFTQAVTNVLSLSDRDWLSMSQAAVAAVAHPTLAESSALFESALARSLTPAP